MLAFKQIYLIDYLPNTFAHFDDCPCVYMYIHTRVGLLALEFFCTRIATRLGGRVKVVGTVLPPAWKNQHDDRLKVMILV